MMLKVSDTVVLQNIPGYSIRRVRKHKLGTATETGQKKATNREDQVHNGQKGEQGCKEWIYAHRTSTKVKPVPSCQRNLK